MSERIQKLLATTGVASRRAIEAMISEGRVTVNGRPAEVGQKISHDDHIRVDGRLIPLSRKTEAARVLLYRKKVGELVTREDPEGRKTVFRKLPELEGGRWIAVGRLDINTSGLLLLTSDGELARRLMHPSFEMRREYAVRVLGTVDAQVLARLRAGVNLEDGFAKFETIEAGANNQTLGEEMDGPANSWWTVTVKQGRNRVVRRLLESQNLQVSRLMRVSYGPITLGRGIKSGSYREADAEELQALLEAVDIKVPTSVRKQTRSKEEAPPPRRRYLDRDGEAEQARAAKPQSWQDGESTRPAKRRPGPPVPGRSHGSAPGREPPAPRFQKPSRSTKRGDEAVFDPSKSVSRLVAKPTPREARFPLPPEESGRNRSQDRSRDRDAGPVPERSAKSRSDRPKAAAKPSSREARFPPTAEDAGRKRSQERSRDRDVSPAPERSAKNRSDRPKTPAKTSSSRSPRSGASAKPERKPGKRPDSRSPSRAGSGGKPSKPSRRKPKS